VLGVVAVVALVTACTRGSSADDAGVGNPPFETLQEETRLDPAAYYNPPTIDAKPPKTFTRSKSAPDFPNVTLIDHEGKEVKFYDDLVKDKIVVINFMFATCQGT
jgi:cytochrome oxidase Cu insertion factor (SCO1/SenC/PrrC family)